LVARAVVDAVTIDQLEVLYDKMTHALFTTGSGQLRFILGAHKVAPGRGANLALRVVNAVRAFQFQIGADGLGGDGQRRGSSGPKPGNRELSLPFPGWIESSEDPVGVVQDLALFKS